MLAAERPEMVMIGSPNHLHLGQLRAALRSDVPHIFTEKPVVISEDETWELLTLMREHGGHGRVLVGLALRYSPLCLALKQAQAQAHGQLGRIVSIEASEHIGPWHGSFFMQDWRRFSRFSGGFMLEKCCHDIDFYAGVVGCRPRHVASFGGRKTFVPENRPERHEYDRMAAETLAAESERIYPFRPRWAGGNSDFESDGDIVDYQTALVEYEDGVNLAFHTNLNVPDEYRRFAIMGTRGMAGGDFVRNVLSRGARRPRGGADGAEDERGAADAEGR